VKVLLVDDHAIVRAGLQRLSPRCRACRSARRRPYARQGEPVGR
jgi:hypothetical protein